MVRVIVVDDQIRARRLLVKQLQGIEDVEVIAEAGDATMGMTLIKKKSPDLVFLDVEMPDKTGFELLESFDKIDFEVIFVTGYSEYAVKAIKKNALDYIIKPVQKEDLIEALQRFQKRSEEQSDGIHEFSNFGQNKANAVGKKMLLTLNKGYKLVDINRITFCESSGRYTIFHIYKSEPITVAKNIGVFEEDLTEKGFVRIHDSFIINLTHFDSYSRDREKYGEAILRDGTKIKVSRTRKSTLLSALRRF